MNKILLTIIGLAAGLSALAQGTVNLNNNFTPPGGTARAFILGVGGAPLAKALGQVEVLSGESVIASGGLGADGLFFLGVTDIPTTSITIRAWDTSSGASYASALIKNEALVTLTQFGGGATPPPALGVAGNFTGLQLEVIPEPSTVALAALGLVGLFFVARRK
ncbi:MAG: PEP-CTERM sorting domain-containing protein [Verrucomicrobiae bacterium]|nr:PEP-CTERM sorting domain-containing protein [Verrucomicrobiae bacterium]